MPGAQTNSSVLELKVRTLHGEVHFGVAVESFLGLVFADSLGLRALTTRRFCMFEVQGKERHSEAPGLEMPPDAWTTGFMPPLMTNIARAGP